MPLIPYNESDVDLLARLIRAEAEGEGRQGEQLVGCVVVNRVFCDCLDFKQLRSVRDAVYQSRWIRSSAVRIFLSTCS